MKKFRFFAYIVLAIVFSSPIFGLSLSTKDGENTAIQQSDSTNITRAILDSTPILTTDSIPTLSFRKDSLSSDSLVVKDTLAVKKDAIDAPVSYQANDSVVFSGNNWGYLYGNSEVNYTSISLKSEYISMSMDSSLVHATFGLDSVNAEFGHPVFSDGGDSYEAKTMRYNFKSKKGFSTQTITEQGEGYVVAGKSKKNADESFFMCDGKYTTCDNHDHPHFYLMLTKAKVRPKKDIVTGPAYLVIADIPMPIGLPFAFFPFTDKYSSGVIMPSYTDELSRGFGLRDGGYYFAINDHIDLAVTGEVHTKGSWGLNARSSYRKRYRYSGNFDGSYLFTKDGEKGEPDYATSKDIRLSWSHTQDPKANMYRTLSASVNFSTSSYNRNKLNEIYNGGYVNNTKNSTVTLSQKFPNSPFTLSANLSAAQRSQDSTIALTMPNLTVTMSRIYPFKRKDAVGEEKWFEKIQFSYTGDLRNSITTKENLLFKSSLRRDWQNAMKHNIPVSATFNLFNYLNVTPSFNYTERWYTQKVMQRPVPGGNSHIGYDTINSFSRVYDFSYAVSMQTKLYGFYEPMFKIGKLQKIRHVFTPSISYSGQPDFSDPIWGFYERYSYYDADGKLQEHIYSPYSQGLFQAPGQGKTGSIGFSFDNNFELKTGTANDSTKIISLIDNLGIRFSYNMQAKEYKWSDIGTNMRLKLSKSLTVNVNATFDPYTYDINDDGRLMRVDKLRITEKGTIGRLKSTSYSISPSINQDSFSKWFGKEEKGKSDDNEQKTDEELENEESAPKEKKNLFSKKESEGNTDADGYTINSVKWDLSANYSFSYAYDMSRFDAKKKEYKMKLTHNLGVNGSIQPSKNWAFNFNTSYDFDQNALAYMTCSLTRNLHCWSLTGSFTPVGPYKSYFVTLRANSSMLQDLKYDKRGRATNLDPEWY